MIRVHFGPVKDPFSVERLALHKIRKYYSGWITTLLQSE